MLLCPCQVGGSYFLSRLPGHMGIVFALCFKYIFFAGLYLALTGARLTGVDLIHAGVIIYSLTN